MDEHITVKFNTLNEFYFFLFLIKLLESHELPPIIIFEFWEHVTEIVISLARIR